MFTDSQYSQFIYKSRYSRYLEKEGRRESWDETIKRYFDFVEDYLLEKHEFKLEVRGELEAAVLRHDIMPSMRALMTAGAAAKRNHVSLYNCAYLPMDDVKSFDEEMAILMSGTGVGYSVEGQYVKNIPELPENFFESETTIVFDDSRLGWSKGFREYVSLLMIGQIPKYDTSNLRPVGARLKTMGGRCLSGDTIVYKDRKVDRGYNEISLAKLFDLQTNFPHRFEQIKLRSLDEDTGEFFRNKIKSVIYNGNRMTYNLVTTKGYRIKATENHRFMNELGEYQFLSEFDVGDKIAVNGSTERKTGICIDCGDNISRRAIRCKECNRVSQFKEDCLDTTSRQRLEVKRYKAGVLFCEICGLENVEFECHHVDGNPWNNNENNLQNLCIQCHREEDMKRIYFGNPYACKYMMYDEIIEISEAGEEEVYDLEMEGPNHNFIANGFVSHNSSGPQPLIDLLEFTKAVFVNAAGRKLTTLEVHDIGCKVADIVVVGGVRRCLKDSTRVQTIHGYQTIDKLNVGDILVTKGIEQKVLGKIYSGKQKTYKINHKFGVIEGATENHQVAVFDSMNSYKFKLVKNLTDKDILVWDSFGNNGEIQKLPSFIDNLHFNSTKIAFPEYLNDDISWLIGLIQGDGYIGPKSIEISGNSNDISMLEYAKDLFKKYFNVEGSLGPDSKFGNGVRLRINSVSLASWFNYNIKISNTDIQIPSFIFKSTKNNRSAYLAGLFDADGRISPDGGFDIVTTIYESLKNDVVTLLSTLGIGSVVSFKNNVVRRSTGVKAKDYYTIRIKGKLNRNISEKLINPFLKSVKKNKIVDYKGKNHDFSWPLELHNHSQGYRGDMSFISSLERGLSKDKGIYPSKISSIVLEEENHTYDIETEMREFTIDGVIVHNSALISLSDLSDDRMRDAKSGNWWMSHPHRRLANNSAVYEERPDMGIFMKEWLSLYESHSGERGIISRPAMRNVIESANEFRKQIFGTAARFRDPNFQWGTNPCLHPDSMIETIHGRVKIKDITEPTMVYSMDKNSKLCVRQASASWISKKNAETIKITIASGKEVICTPDHKIYIEGRGWIEAQNIRIKDKVVHLVRNRRGAAYSGVKLTTQDKKDIEMEHRLVYQSYYGPIPEGYDIHHIDGDTYNNDIDNLECLSHEDHSRLTALEQPNNHMVSGFHGKGSNGFGFISPENSRHGRKTIIPIPDDLKSNLHQYATVEKIESGPVTDVYDITVEDTHNFIANFVVVHNCSEIILRPYEFCNLTEVIIYEDDTPDTIREKVRLATILGTIQSCFTNFKYLNKKWQKNCEDERLLGVSLTGIYDNKYTNGRYSESQFKHTLDDFLSDLKAGAIRTNFEFAALIGIESSVAITCVKPSGTSSALNGTSSGIHPAHAPYYWRYVRNDIKDPLTQFMIANGFPFEKDAYDPNNVVCFKFPIKASKDAVFKKDLRAIDHLKLWLTYQKNWCEHKPSITVSVKESEWLEVGDWVYKNFDWVSGISFLPAEEGSTVYKQPPFFTVSEEEYDSLLSQMPSNIDWARLVDFELYDTTTNAQELACTGPEGCEIR